MERLRRKGHCRAIIAGICFVLAGAGRAVAGEADLAPSLPTAPVNTWVELPTSFDRGMYDCSQPIYVPTRGQVLHWGGVERR